MIPFGSTGSFQFRKILSSKGVPFNDFAGTGPGTAMKRIVYVRKQPPKNSIPPITTLIHMGLEIDQKKKNKHLGQQHILVFLCNGL